MLHRYTRLIFLVCFLTSRPFFPVLNATPVTAICPPDTISSGIWRAELLRADGHNIAFTFQVTDSAGKKIIYIQNGTERLLVENIRSDGDSLFIDMPFFDSHFSLYFKNKHHLEGNWIKFSGERKTVVPFHAYFGDSDRFPVHYSPLFDISGRWSVLFRGVTDTTLAVGEFKQTGALVRGTF